MEAREKKEVYTKYEKARILGARALQISMNAPLLLAIPKEKLDQINYDPLKIAELEFEAGILPITVRRPLPQREEKEEKEEAEEEEIEKELELEERAGEEQTKAKEKVVEEVAETGGVEAALETEETETEEPATEGEISE